MALEVLTPASIRFAHAVNSSELLHSALADPRIRVLEADVVANARSVVVMGHEPETASDLSFSTFLSAAHAAGRGVKVDIKMRDATDRVIRDILLLQAVIDKVCCTLGL